MLDLERCLVIDTEGNICKMRFLGDSDWDDENPIATIDDIVTIAGGYLSSEDQWQFEIELEKLLNK